MKRLITDLFTGPDGRTWAIGRIYSLPVLITGLAAPLLMLAEGQRIDLAALGAMFGGLGAAVMALVLGTNATEPKDAGAPRTAAGDTGS